jgi:hypothetical protein
VGLTATLGRFSGLYGSGRPYLDGAQLLVTTALSLSGAVGLGLGRTWPRTETGWPRTRQRHPGRELPSRVARRSGRFGNALQAPADEGGVQHLARGQ